jgi:hypothetical protein
MAHRQALEDEMTDHPASLSDDEITTTWRTARPASRLTDDPGDTGDDADDTGDDADDTSDAGDPPDPGDSGDTGDGA